MTDLKKFKCAYNKVVPIDQLVPNPRNNNAHPERQIERLAKIIDFQGMRSPIVVSKRSGFVIKGHGRLEAIKKLGWENAPVDFQDYANEATEFADMTADNRIASWAEFNDEKFKLDLKDIEFDIDLDLLGVDDFKLFDDKEIDDNINQDDEINIDDLDSDLDLECPKCKFRYSSKQNEL